PALWAEPPWIPQAKFRSMEQVPLAKQHGAGCGQGFGKQTLPATHATPPCDAHTDDCSRVHTPLGKQQAIGWGQTPPVQEVEEEMKAPVQFCCVVIEHPPSLAQQTPGVEEFTAPLTATMTVVPAVSGLMKYRNSTVLVLTCKETRSTVDW